MSCYLSTYLARLQENLPLDSRRELWANLRSKALAAERTQDYGQLRLIAEELDLDPYFYEYQIKL